MKLSSFFASLDLAIQTLIIIPTLTSILFVIAAPSGFIVYMLGLFFLGGWQLLSAFSHFLFKQDRFRGWYLMASLTYLGMLALGTYIFEEFNFKSDMLFYLGVIFFGVIPGIAGVWYYKLTLSGEQYEATI